MTCFRLMFMQHTFSPLDGFSHPSLWTLVETVRGIGEAPIMERKELIWSGSSSNLAGAMLMVRTLFVALSV